MNRKKHNDAAARSRKVDDIFSSFDTAHECDGQTDGHQRSSNTVLRRLLRVRFDFDSTLVRRAFECLSKGH